MIKWSGLMLLWLFSWAVQADWRLHEAEDLTQIAQRAEKRNVPVVILFSRVVCGPCERFKENALLPLVENGLVEEYVEVVEVFANADQTVKDFSGERIPNSVLAEFYNVTTFPKLVFLSPQGEPLGIRMENSGAYDYFPYYLSENINLALEKIGNPLRVNEGFVQSE